VAIKVCVKYCGGCNPTYDRLELSETIRKSLGAKADFVSADSENVDLILAIQGCETACADLSYFANKRVFIITGLKDVDRFFKFFDGFNRD
jgi:hypothetical protein